MMQIGILWNSMSDYYDEVLYDLIEFIEVKDYFDIDLKDNLSNFIWNIYGNASELVIERVKKKIEYTDGMYENKMIRIILMNIKEEQPQYEITQYIKKIKQYIRKKYENKVKYYSYDNIFHMTEDEEELKKVIEALKKSVPQKTNLTLVKRINNK